MSGMALSTDGQRLFFVSGNGDGHENAGTPASGGSGCRTLGEACVCRVPPISLLILTICLGYAWNWRWREVIA